MQESIDISLPRFTNGKSLIKYMSDKKLPKIKDEFPIVRFDIKKETVSSTLRLTKEDNKKEVKSKPPSIKRRLSLPNLKTGWKKKFKKNRFKE